MNIPVHRQTDKRSCGATTRVVGQSNVYANNLLVSVYGDIDSHQNGKLLATVNDGTVFINNLKVVLKGSNATPDNALHANPRAYTGSPNVFACGGGNSSTGYDSAPDETVKEKSSGNLYPDPNAETPEEQRPLTDSEYTPPASFDAEDQAKIAELENNPDWQAKLSEMEAKYPGLDRDQLYKIIKGESNFNPEAVNANSGATGLFQLTPQAASELGYSTDQIARMSPAEQLNVYDKYLERWNYNSSNHLGIMQAAPAYADKSPNTVVYPIGSPAWRQNPGWRPSDGGHITVASINDYYDRS